jgi:hypothetical protein
VMPQINARPVLRDTERLPTTNVKLVISPIVLPVTIRKKNARPAKLERPSFQSGLPVPPLKSVKIVRLHASPAAQEEPAPNVLPPTS